MRIFIFFRYCKDSLFEGNEQGFSVAKFHNCTLITKGYVKIKVAAGQSMSLINIKMFFFSLSLAVTTRGLKKTRKRKGMPSMIQFFYFCIVLFIITTKTSLDVGLLKTIKIFCFN